MRSRRAFYGLPLIPCGWCGQRIRETESGRRRWCSNACRMSPTGHIDEVLVRRDSQNSGPTARSLGCVLGQRGVGTPVLYTVDQLAAPQRSLRRRRD